MKLCSIIGTIENPKSRLPRVRWIILSAESPKVPHTSTVLPHKKPGAGNFRKNCCPGSESQSSEESLELAIR